MKSAKALLLFALLLFPNSSIQAQSKLDSLRNAFDRTTQSKDKLNTAKILFGQYVYYKVDSALYFAQQALELAESLEDEAEQIQAKKYLGIGHAVKGEFDQAIPYMSENLAYYLEQGDSLNVAYSYNNIGLNYLYAGNDLKAVENLLESVRLKERLVEGGLGLVDADLGSTLLNIGIAYQNQLDSARAKTFYSNAIKRAKEAENTVLEASAKTSLANLQIAQSLYDSAVVNLNAVLPVFEARNDLFSLGKVYNNLSIAYSELNQGARALDFAKKGIDTNEQIGNQQSEGLGYVYLGLAHLTLNQNRSAITASKKAVEIGNSLSNDPMLQGAYENLTSAYAALGQYKQAYDYAELLKDVRARVYANDKAAQIDRLSAQYEAQKRELEIDKLSQQTELQTLEIKQANTRNSLLLILFLSLLVILLLTAFFYRKIARNRKELASLNSTKDRLFSIISHDLRSHISAFQSTGKLIGSFIKKQDFEKLDRLSVEVEKSATNVNHLLDNLLQWSLEQQSGYVPKPETFNLSQLVNELKEVFTPFAEQKGLSLESDIASDLEVSFDKGALSLSLRNLMANGIKFTEEGGLKIKANTAPSEVVLSISDTGIGIPQDMLANIFEIGEDKIRTGTSNEKGTGLGLHLVHQFIRMNAGSLNVDSVEGEGTTFYIALPNG